MQPWWRNCDFILILSGFCGLPGTTGARWTQALMRWGTLKNYGSAGGLGQFGEYGTVGNVARIFRNSLNLAWGSFLEV